MFTGLIESVGAVYDLRQRGDYTVLTIDAAFTGEPLVMGESIAVDGTCLTVVSFEEQRFAVEASAESAARTIVGSYSIGSRVNLERAMKLGARMGGHFVSGHIDERGSISSLRRVGESLELTLTFDRRFDPLVIEKGSIAINGVSLTINKVEPGLCTVNIIPHTATNTTLRELKQGQQANLEFDMIGKYILKSKLSTQRDVLTEEKLRESGW